MTETQERFLRSVLTLVPLESVVEMHLFPPIRRGTLETGVAVIATSLPAQLLAVVEETVDAVTESADDVMVVTEEVAPSDDASVIDESAVVVSDSDDTPATIGTTPAALDAVPQELPETQSITAPRLRILTASYRHTIKGVERGKWTFDVQVEADAPYEAVELVLRGVRHRSSEPADPELVHVDVLTALNAPTRVAPAA